jgi:pimeloyl-ACP methyl ester carboxylesterase
MNFKTFLLAMLVWWLAASIVHAQEKSTQAPDFRVAVTGEGDPLILIPGLSCDGAVWAATVAVLSKNYTCHVLTLPGFAGVSPVNLDQGFLPKIEAQIIRYIQQKLTQKPIIVGHSLGGFLALSMAIHHQELLRKIVIVDSYAFLPAAYQPQLTEKTAIPQAEAMKAMMLATSDSLFRQQQLMTMRSMVTDPQWAEKAVEWSLASHRPSVAQAMYDLMTTDLRPQVKAVKIPVLIFGSWMGGKDYGITKERVSSLFQSQYGAMHGVQIKIAETAKHFIMWDEPEWFHTQLLTFLSNGE